MKKKGPYWTNRATEKEFNRIINYLKMLSKESFWRKNLNLFRSNLCHYDSGNRKFKTIIKKLN